LTRNFLEFRFPLFEEILLVSTFAALLTFGLTFFLKNVGFLKDTIQLLCYVNILALMLSVLVLPYSLLNVDRSRSFYVLSWVNQGKISEASGQIVLRVESEESSDIAGVKLRLIEQKQRGLIREIGGQYEVTGKGELALGIANTLAKIFNLKNWEFNRD
jgi:hypothetical protein